MTDNIKNAGAGLDLTKKEFERACELLPPDFFWGLPVTPRLVLDIAQAALATPQADAAPSEDAYVAKRLSEALADVYMTIIGTDTPEAGDGSNAIERVKKAAQVLRLEVDLHRSQADAAPLPREATTVAPLAYPAEFTDELQWILGLMCFQCIQYAQTLRKGGRSIPTNAEAEQAATLDWMLRYYMRDPENWRKTAAAEMRAMNAASGDQS